MKKNSNSVRSIMFKLRISVEEKKQLKELQNKSTEQSLSNYIRKVSLQKPVIIKYRNQSADDFLNSMLELKRQLNGIGNNFNQSVKKLHTLDKIPEFRVWLQSTELMQQSLITTMEEIKWRMNQLYQEWSQK
jgi:hypothetical protein